MIDKERFGKLLEIYGDLSDFFQQMVEKEKLNTHETYMLYDLLQSEITNYRIETYLRMRDEVITSGIDNSSEMFK